MDLPFGQPSGGAACPCGDKLFAPKLAEDRFLAMDRTHALFAIVTAVSVQLCSLLDSSGHLQESSRKHALLQAAYLPRRKMVIAHHFLTLSVLAIVPLPGVLSKFFLRGGRISFSHAYSKNKSLRTAAYLFSSHWMPATVRSSPWTKWFPGFSWNTVSMPLLW